MPDSVRRKRSNRKGRKEGKREKGLKKKVKEGTKRERNSNRTFLLDT